MHCICSLHSTPPQIALCLSLHHPSLLLHSPKNSFFVHYLPMDVVPTSAPKKVCRVRTQGQYMGVRMRSWGKWVSEIRIPHTKRRIWLGSYDDPEKAARAYDAALYCIRGESGRFNFPDDKRPMLPKGEVGFLSKEDIQAFATNFASSDASVTPPVSSSESVRFDCPDDRRSMLRKGAVDFLSKEDIQTVAANFASLDAPVTSPVSSSVSTQVSPVLPDFWVSSEMEIACDVDAGSLTSVSVTEAATTSGESLQLDDMLTLDEDWLSDLF